MENENKQDILDALTFCLRKTRSQHDLKELIYDSEKETVTIVYSDGGTTVNVALDSGIAMIRDVLRSMGG